MCTFIQLILCLLCIILCAISAVAAMLVLVSPFVVAIDKSDHPLTLKIIAGLVMASGCGNIGALCLWAVESIPIIGICD